MTIRLLLADDHRIFRDGLRPLLDGRNDLEIVGEADNGLAALELCRSSRPDVAVLDISMPGMNGIEVTRTLARELPDVRVIILSMHSDRRFVQEALRAGARGYVLKDAGFDELLAGVLAVAAGRYHLDAGIGEQVVRDYLDLVEADSGSVFGVLSAREREVLQMLAEGRSTKEIAADLHLSAKTVESHRKAVMDKLDIHSIAELTKYAIRQGLTQLD
ncbi:response regulator transcription factor [bacterium]|nr:response regulator transcription factor [bacterium]